MLKLQGAALQSFGKVNLFLLNKNKNKEWT